MFDVESDSGTEGDELVEVRHVDAVVVGVANLRTGTDEHHLLGVQAVEDADDALAEGRASHDGVVDDDEVVHLRFQGAVGDVIDVGSEVVALVALRDEGAELDVLDGNLLAADVVMEDGTQLFPRGAMLLCQSVELLDLLLIHLLLESVEHAVERHFGRVGHVAEDRVLEVAVDGLVDLRGELFTEGFAFAVDVAVTASAEVYALERAGVIAFRSQDLGEGDVAVLVNRQCLSGEKLADAVSGQVEGGLDDRALACHHQDLVVPIPERRTDAPRIAHGEHLTAASEAAQHIAAVEERGGGAQDVGDVDVVLDVSGQVGAGESLHIGDVVDAFALAVQTVPHQFEHDVGVVVDARVLTHGSDLVEHLVHVRQVEVAAEAQVLGSPVVAAHEGVDMGESALAGGGVAEMSHEDLCIFPTAGADVAEDFGDGAATQSTFAEHVFLAGFGVEVGAGDTGALLTSVVLLLHEEVELVETVG